MSNTLTNEELTIINTLCECPYNTEETYKDCVDCEYHEEMHFCSIDFIRVKISNMLKSEVVVDDSI